jgi:hypothetical protein
MVFSCHGDEFTIVVQEVWEAGGVICLKRYLCAVFRTQPVWAVRKIYRESKIAVQGSYVHQHWSVREGCLIEAEVQGLLHQRCSVALSLCGWDVNSIDSKVLIRQLVLR